MDIAIDVAERALGEDLILATGRTRSGDNLAKELALALQKRYAIRIESNAKHASQHFATIANLAAYVDAQRTACAS